LWSGRPKRRDCCAKADSTGSISSISSPTQVDRLLDPKNDITLSSLQRAAAKVDLDDYLAALLVGEKSNTGHGG